MMRSSGYQYSLNLRYTLDTMVTKDNKFYVLFPLYFYVNLLLRNNLNFD